MSLALCGAHRTGKSTLARAFSEKQAFTFLPSRAGEAHKELNLPVGQGLSSEDRLRLQERILDYHVEDIHNLTGQLWVSDRSSLDFATYTLLDAAADPTYDHERVSAYVNRCFHVANKYYGMVVLVQPGIPYVEGDGKPPTNVSQQEAFNFMLWGLAQDRRLDTGASFIRRDVLALDDRVDVLTNLIHLRYHTDMEVARMALRH